VVWVLMFGIGGLWIGVWCLGFEFEKDYYQLAILLTS